MQDHKIAEIKVGFSCNNNCRFCCNAHKRRLGYLSTRDIEDIILVCKEEGRDYISFTGGEPTIRKDFFEICSFVRENEMNLEIQTNGRMFSYEEFTKKSSDIGLHCVLVSLHAHKSRLGDFLARIPNSFEQTIEGIKNLREYGNFVVTNTVINKFNAKALPKIAEFLVTLEVNQIQFLWPEPMGNALDDFYEIVPGYSSVIDNLKRAVDVVDSHGINARLMGIPLCILGPYDKFKIKIPEKIVFEMDKNENSIVIEKSKMSKSPACENCNRYTDCNGIYREYTKRYGFKEFKPRKIKTIL